MNPGPTMDHDLLRRVRKTSIIIGLPLAIIITTYWGISAGGGWAAGMAWSIVNLYFIGSLVKKVVTTEKRQTAGIVVTVFIKFPVLYAAGFLLLWNGYLSVAGLVAGFTWPFLVLLMKGLGRYYLKLDETRNAAGDEAAVNSEGKASRA
jgi:hypothetical protein